jgi:hypothetical protein
MSGQEVGLSTSLLPLDYPTMPVLLSLERLTHPKRRPTQPQHQRAAYRTPWECHQAEGGRRVRRTASSSVLKGKQPLSTTNAMHPTDHMSTDSEWRYLPTISGAMYCLVPHGVAVCNHPPLQ